MCSFSFFRWLEEGSIILAWNEDEEMSSSLARRNQWQFFFGGVLFQIASISVIFLFQRGTRYFLLCWEVWEETGYSTWYPWNDHHPFHLFRGTCVVYQFNKIFLPMNTGLVSTNIQNTWKSLYMYRLYRQRGFRCAKGVAARRYE